MTEMFITWAGNVPGTWAFAAVLLVLLFCGLGIPMPEEIPIIAAAYLAYDGAVSLPWCIVLVVAAALTGDTLIFFVGRHFGPRVFQLPVFRTLITRRRIKRANVYFHRWGNSVVFLGRFLAGVRSTVFLTAAILRMPFRRFLLLDGLAACLSIPLNILLVYGVLTYFGEDIRAALKASRRMGTHAAVGAVLIVAAIVALVVYSRWRRKRARRLKTQTPGVFPPGVV